MTQNSALHQQYLIPTYPFRGKTFVKGKGVYLYDEAGKKYLDLMSNYGVSIFGYAHPRLVAAIAQQLEILPTLHGSFANDIRSQASKELVTRCGSNFSQVYWANSGTEAVEAAIKFAIVASGKTHFIAARGSYHGKTLGSLSVTFNPKYRLPFKRILPRTSFVPYGDIFKLRQAVTPKTAAIILEPIQGETGIIIPPPGYLKQVAAFCHERHLILIIDEIQTGLGRTGTFLASHQETVRPDMVCLGKGLAGSIPVGATVVTSAIAQKLAQGIHTSTFGGNPLACAGVIATLSLLTQRQLSSNTELGKYFLQQLQAIKHPQVKQVRGQGLMIGLELRQKNTPVLKALQDRGVLAIPAGDHVVRFLPPYIITKTQVDTAVSALNKILKS